MKILQKVSVNGVPVIFEVDTGSPIVLIGRDLFDQKFSKSTSLQNYVKKLFTATGQQMKICGSFIATISGAKGKGRIEIVVYDGHREYPLLGETGLDILFPDWRSFFEVNNLAIKDLESEIILTIKNKFDRLTNGDLSVPINDFEVDLHLRSDHVPIFAKARSIPYGLQEIARQLLDKLVSQNVIEPIEDSNWASPIVMVKKLDGSYRLCIDPSKTLNPQLTEDHYPLPTVDNLLVAIGGHKLYSVVQGCANS